MSTDKISPRIWHRVLGGFCGACGGAAIGLGVAIFVNNCAKLVFTLELMPSVAVGAVVGLVFGLVFPKVALIVAQLSSMFT